jgi:hypothetical protein
MTAPIESAGNIVPPSPSSSDVPAISQKLRSHVLNVAANLQQLMAQPGLTDNPDFINECHQNLSLVQRSVQDALNLR